MKHTLKQALALLITLLMALSGTLTALAEGMDEVVSQPVDPPVAEQDLALGAWDIAEALPEPGEAAFASRSLAMGANGEAAATYVVDIDDSIENGTVALVDPRDRYAEGETVTIAVTPDEGYELS